MVIMCVNLPINNCHNFSKSAHATTATFQYATGFRNDKYNTLLIAPYFAVILSVQWFVCCARLLVSRCYLDYIQCSYVGGT